MLAESARRAHILKWDGSVVTPVLRWGEPLATPSGTPQVDSDSKVAMSAADAVGRPIPELLTHVPEDDAVEYTDRREPRAAPAVAAPAPAAAAQKKKMTRDDWLTAFPLDGPPAMPGRHA